MSIFEHTISQIELFGTEQIIIDESIYSRKPNMFEFRPKYQNQYKIHYSDKHGVLLSLTISLCLENGVYAFDEVTECDYIRIDILGDTKRYIHKKGNEVADIESAIMDHIESKLKFYNDLKDKINAP